MNTVLSATHSDAAFYRNRQAMLIYPLIVLPFIAVLFWLFGGGKGERYLTEDAAVNKAGVKGFNARVPTAKNGSIDNRAVDGPGYGKAQIGQVLSKFTNVQQGADSQGLNAIPVSNSAGGTATTHVSSLANTAAAPVASISSRPVNQANRAAIAATRPARSNRKKMYYYNPPGSQPGYNETATDRQLDEQLRQYELSRRTPATPLTIEPITSEGKQGEEKALATDSKSGYANPATIHMTDYLTASRLHDAADTKSPFLTASTEGSRAQPTRAILSGGSYGNRKTIAWMIPVVIHEDQAVKEGQQVKLRLLKEITADGITIPANTILYAICQLSDDRLRLTVRSLQLGGQLIPLDLDVYDTDGSPGINVPGLSQNSQVGGQIRSSAIQAINVPSIGGLGNTVLSSARMGASQSLRQTTIRLRAGYNLFLKTQ